MQKVRHAGFTLVELMIVVAIMGILAAVAYPAYTRHVVKSRRTDAQRLLVEQAAGIERFYSVNGVYSTSAPTCGGVTMSNTAYYVYTCVGATSSFTLTATPASGSSQTSDGSLTLDNTGAKTGTWTN